MFNLMIENKNTRARRAKAHFSSLLMYSLNILLDYNVNDKVIPMIL